MQQHRGGNSSPYDEHGDQDVLLEHLGVGEDVLQHGAHVRFVLLPQVDDTFVVVSWKGTAALATANETTSDFNTDAAVAFTSPC